LEQLGKLQEFERILDSDGDPASFWESISDWPVRTQRMLTGIMNTLQ